MTTRQCCSSNWNLPGGLLDDEQRARFELMPPFEQSREYRLDIGYVVADDSKQCKANIVHGKILLILNALIDRDKHVEVARDAA